MPHRLSPWETISNAQYCFRFEPDHTPGASRLRGCSRNVREADGFLSGSLTLKSKREIEQLAAGALPTLQVLVQTLTIPSSGACSRPAHRRSTDASNAPGGLPHVAPCRSSHEAAVFRSLPTWDSDPEYATDYGVEHRCIFIESLNTPQTFRHEWRRSSPNLDGMSWGWGARQSRGSACLLAAGNGRAVIPETVRGSHRSACGDWFLTPPAALRIRGLQMR